MIKPLVSIIIINYNGKKLLKDCLESIKKINYPNYQIILVDNNSSDGTHEYVKENYPEISMIRLDSNFGFAYPNNVGAKKSQGEFLLFLNNDTIVEPDFLDSLVTVINSDQNIAICQSMLLKPDGQVDSSGDFIDSIGVAFSTFEKIKETREIFSAKAASMIVRRDVFEKLGGFDEKFFISFEDVDLSWRARIMGYRILINPKSVVYHLGGQTTNKLKEEIIFHGLKNQLILKITNFETRYSIRSLIIFFSIYGFRMLRVLFDHALKGKTQITATKYEPRIAQKPNLKIILKVVFWLIKNHSYLQNKNRKVNSTRIITTREMKQKKLIV
jgi:GT2 family glycosyltransferase